MKRVLDSEYQPQVNSLLKQKAERILCPEFWDNRRVETAGPATLHMRPLYASINLPCHGKVAMYSCSPACVLGNYTDDVQTKILTRPRCFS
jgi:hypothetical protein